MDRGDVERLDYIENVVTQREWSSLSYVLIRRSGTIVYHLFYYAFSYVIASSISPKITSKTSKQGRHTVSNIVHRASSPRVCNPRSEPPSDCALRSWHIHLTHAQRFNFPTLIGSFVLRRIRQDFEGCSFAYRRRDLHISVNFVHSSSRSTKAI
jgi:hypothetical protein